MLSGKSNYEKTFFIIALNDIYRSGISVTSRYALKECSRLLKVGISMVKSLQEYSLTSFQTVDDTAEYQELQNLQERLDSKIRVCTVLSLQPTLELSLFESRWLLVGNIIGR